MNIVFVITGLGLGGLKSKYAYWLIDWLRQSIKYR